MFFRELVLPALIPLQHSAENDVKGRFLCAFVWPIHTPQYLEANMDMTRSATITIHAGDETVDIMINQMAMSGATSFKLFTDEKKANAFANKTTLNFKSTFDTD